MAGKDFSVYVNIGGRVASSLSAAINTTKGKLDGLTRHLRAQAAAQKAAIRGMMDSFKGMAALAAGGGLVFSIKKAFGDGAELAHEIQGLRNAGRTAQEVAEGMNEAIASIKEMPTANLTNSVKLLKETTGAFGDYHHAVENLKFNSKLGDVLKNTIGVDDPAHAIGSLIKALEIRGSAANPEKYKREAEGLQKAMTFFGGRLTPDMIYAFASNAQQGVRQLNERFLTKIAPSLIQEMGGEKVGTGLTAFRTIISGRKISDIEQAKAWAKLGLLNMKEVKHNKAGQITGWRDGAIAGTRLAYKDPLAYMESVILPRLKKKGTDITDPIKLGAALTTLFKNTKANAFVTAISTVVDRARLKKDEALINKVLSIDENYDQSLLNDPKLAKFAIVQAMRNIGAALTGPMMKPIAQWLISVARAMNQFSAALMANPGLARVVAGLVAALTAMAAIRIASFVFGLTGLARAIFLLGVAAPLGLASRLIGLAVGIRALAVASLLGGAAALRRMAIALIAINGIGGARAVLSTVGAALLGLGARVAMFPLFMLRGIGFAIRGLLIGAAVGTGITAIVAALAALGLWVANNWEGLKTFAVSFGESFTKHLGPETSKGVTAISDALIEVFDWINKLLGPIDEVGTKWASWGEAAGKGAAAAVTALAALPGEMAKVGQQAWTSLVNIDWRGAGKTIVTGIVAGITSMGGAIGNAIKGGIGYLGGKLGIGGPAPAAPPGPYGDLSGTNFPARAMGGPVIRGMPYLVGERGPEIFVPDSHGAIKTNGFLNGLGGVGGPSVDVSAVSRTTSAARQAGSVLHASLDATRTPVVDTTSIEAATEKASRLSTILASIGNSSIDVGGLTGGGGGGGGGSWNGKALAIGNGAGIGHVASQAERAAFIKSYASSIGMDATTALRVAQSEGFNKYTGDHGRSFGDFQLFTGGGVGNRALRLGINVRDPKQWRAADKFALDVAKREGWAQWHGARRVGIGNWHGIHAARAMGGPVGSGLPYLVGENGPEIFTPGASGQISTNGTLARLTEIGAAMGREGKFGPSAEAVARNRANGSVTHVRGGDTHMSNEWHIHGASNPQAVQRQVESYLGDFLLQMESEQRGLLSD